MKALSPASYRDIVAHILIYRNILIIQFIVLYLYNLWQLGSTKAPHIPSNFLKGTYQNFNFILYIERVQRLLSFKTKEWLVGHR